MTFETEYVAIASVNGDAIVPAEQAVALAKEEAKDTGQNVTIRDEFTDELFATVTPNGEVEVSLPLVSAGHAVEVRLPVAQ